MQLQYPTREDVYERIWRATLRATAEEIGISSHELAAQAQAMAIPRPTTGYWAKLRAGKSVTRPPLPPRPPGAACCVDIGWVVTSGRSAAEILTDPVPPEPVFTESLEDLRERLALQAVAAGRALPGAVILLSEPPSQRGRRVSRPASSDPRHAFLVELSAFLACFVATPEIWEAEPGRFIICIYATRIEFRLSPSERDGNPVGALWLSRGNAAGGKTHFMDSNVQGLDAQIPEIGIAILLAAEASYRERAQYLYRLHMEKRRDAEEGVRRQKAAVKQQREDQRREQAERRRDRLLDQADDWRTARDIRGFVAEVMSGTHGKRKTRRLQVWADWALSEADLIDPVKQGGLIPPVDVRKAMRERLARRPAGDTRTVSSRNRFTESGD
ncbi:MAG: hypothetical protein JHC96_10490 [Brevundimonas sp.]|uniref:hypothetical protein n=1 Tax=Brevundimonas sp. TaxID=1871086 RepID=UPI001A25E36B|nr:hypothetical protein [Brevundimonas sp.]MBJ7319216.1 hypothetical protein [Brevundimonas sp.]